MSPVRDEPAFSGVFSGVFLASVALALAGVLGSRVLGGCGAGEGEPRPVVVRADLHADEVATITLFESASPSVVNIESRNVRLNLWARREGRHNG